MKDELITFETAKLAKKKKFNEPSYYFINDEGEQFNMLYIDNTDVNSNYVKFYARPTQSLLQRWLREVHNINVYCTPCINEKEWINNIASHNPPFVGTYEKALELGLHEALKLIK